MALYRSWLAMALADANEPEQVAEEARRMFGVSAEITSERTAVRAGAVIRRLKSFEDVREVRSLLADFGPFDVLG